MEISRFHGITVHMYHREHGPPHFHAYHGEYRVSVEIWSGTMRGRFPPRSLRLLLEWYDLHRAELIRNWTLIRDGSTPERIDPLA